MLSNCCNAPIIENTDLCSDCKEHCEPILKSKFVMDCRSCMWHMSDVDKQRDRMCRDCCYAYTSNWTKRT